MVCFELTPHKTEKHIKDKCPNKHVTHGSLQVNSIKSQVCMMQLKVGSSLAILVRVHSQSGSLALEGGDDGGLNLKLHCLWSECIKICDGEVSGI